MSMSRPHRRFITPISGNGSASDPWRPKYSTDFGVKGCKKVVYKHNDGLAFVTFYAESEAILDSIESEGDVSRITEGEWQ